MATKDRRGAVVSSTDPATATSPNPGTAYKTAAKCATTANIALSGLQTIDTIATAAGDRVLVWRQTNPIENGIYNVAAGTWSRATDADSNPEFIGGVQVYVLNGALYGGKAFVCTNTDAVSIGSTPITWMQVPQPPAALEFVIDGGGTTILTGDRIFIEVPFDCSIIRSTLVSSIVGNIVIDLYRASYSNFPAVASICGAALPKLVAAQKSQDSTLTGWSVLLSKGDILTAHVQSVSGLVLATLSLLVSRS